MEDSSARFKQGLRRGSTGSNTGHDGLLSELTAISRSFGIELEAEGTGTALLQRRKEAMSKVLSDPGSPYAWRRFFENEDNLRQLVLETAGAADATSNDAATSSAKWERALHRLNDLAARKLVSSSIHRKSSDYVYLLLRLGRG